MRISSFLLNDGAFFARLINGLFPARSLNQVSNIALFLTVTGQKLSFGLICCFLRPLSGSVFSSCRLAAMIHETHHQNNHSADYLCTLPTLTCNRIKICAHLARGDIAISSGSEFLGYLLHRLKSIFNIAWIQFVFLLFSLLWIDIGNTETRPLQRTLLLQNT